MPNAYLTGLLALNCFAGCAPTATFYLVGHAKRANNTNTTSLSAGELHRADRLVAKLTQRIRTFRNKSALVVGHSNTVPNTTA